MECLQGNVKTAIVADVLTERQLTIHFLAVHYLNR